MRYDFCVIGGGIVGLATAMELLHRRPGASLLLLEKEDELARHQSGHNSGVIHSGIYYEPGSFKAELCREGARLTREFCDEQGIAVLDCGKMLVATTAQDVARLDALATRAETNGVAAERLDAAELHRREPHIRGLAALQVDSTAVVDYRQVAQAMARVVRDRGGEIRLGTTVTGIDERMGDGVRVTAATGSWSAARLIVCGGVQADRLARLAGLAVDFQIVPFRGEFYRLAPMHNNLIGHLIYPVPDPNLPFLGIHLTRTVDGGVTVGPNAVLGWAREKYPRHSITPRDVATYAVWPGAWRMARDHLGVGLRELRNSWWKRGYLHECRRYCPELQLSDLTSRHAGIRAQAVMRDGTLAHDFLFVETERTLHVGNAPSPAATSAMPIGAHIAERLLHR